MQYFKALNIGRKRVDAARAYLDSMTGGRAMPALALSDSTGNSWNPVGDENLYVFVDESSGFVLTDDSGYILALTDSRGYSKAVVQGVTQSERAILEERLKKDNIRRYEGKVILPV